MSIAEGKEWLTFNFIVDIRRRIELLQDFSMPHVSNVVKITKDNQYIFTAGTYKPRIRVYDTNQLSMKYEKVLDSHAIQIVCLEEDYTKVTRLMFNFPNCSSHMVSATGTAFPWCNILENLKYHASPQHSVLHL